MRRIFLVLLLGTMACQPSGQYVEKQRPETPPTLPITSVSNRHRPDYDTSEWIELRHIPDSLLLDLKYAGEDNFTGKAIYPCPRCFLSKSAGAAFHRMRKDFNRQGYLPVLLDCYRPLSAQQRLWKESPNPSYVSHPSHGPSMHNKGLALDLTLADGHGITLDMGSNFDDFSKKSHHDYTHPENIRQHRTLLKETCIRHGFLPIRTEWWHYSYRATTRPASNFQWSCD